MNRINPQEAAQSLFRQLHPTADRLLLAGSFVRGEATESSDLDIVILYFDMPHAYRESLVWEGYPVELFVHSPPHCVTSLKNGYPLWFPQIDANGFGKY